MAHGRTKAATARSASRRRRRRSALLALVAVASLALSSCDWLQVGYGPGRSNANPYEPALTRASLPTLTEAFSLDLPAGSKDFPIVVGGSLVVASLDGTTASVSSYDAATGVPKWSIDLPGEVSSVQPVASNGRALVVNTVPAADTPTSITYALNPADGSTAWTYEDTTGDTFTGFLVVGSKVVVGAAINETCYLNLPQYCGISTTTLDANTGAVVRQGSSPSARGGASYLATDDGTLVVQKGVGVQAGPGPGGLRFVTNVSAYDLADGSLRWSYEPSFDQPEQLSVWAGTGSRLIGRSSDGPVGSAVVTFDSDLSDLTYGDSDPGFLEAVSGRYAVLTAADQLTVLRMTDLTRAWGLDLSNGLAARASIVGSVLYLATPTDDGARLTTYDLVDGTELSSLPVPAAATPVVSNGRVYLTSGGTLHAYAPA